MRCRDRVPAGPHWIIIAMKGKRLTTAQTMSVTRFLYIVTVVCALVWVSISYGIAIYSTVRLGVVYTMSELSQPAITTILGVVMAKTLANIFEHNNGKLFGQSDKEETKNDSSEVI